MTTARPDQAPGLPPRLGPLAVLDPLKHRLFAWMWFAMVVSSTGHWMQEVAAGWLLSGMTRDPVMISALQAATMLPVFLLALPAGALGDRLDRRKLLIVMQSFLLVLALVLYAMTLMGMMTPWLLLLFAFLSGIGLALSAPARQAITPSLVPREDIRAAVTLNAIGFNGARALGPALGGALIVIAGVALPFLVNAISYLAVLIVLLLWRHEQAPRPAPRSLLVEAAAGLRLAWKMMPLRACILRAVVFFTFASCAWALMPLIGRMVAGDQASGYGFLVAAIGAGAVLGGLALPHVRVRFGIEGCLGFGAAITVLGLLLIGWLASYAVTVLGFLAYGAGWILVLSTLNGTVQLATPEPYRARMLSIYMIVFSGALSGGSLLWGWVASRIGPTYTFDLAAALLLGAYLLARLLPVSEDEPQNLSQNEPEKKTPSPAAE